MDYVHVKILITWIQMTISAKVIKKLFLKVSNFTLINIQQNVIANVNYVDMKIFACNVLILKILLQIFMVNVLVKINTIWILMTTNAKVLKYYYKNT